VRAWRQAVSNQDDATALLCVFRGIAFREQGYYEATREAFKEALRSKKRDPVVRHRALLERAKSYLNEGGGCPDRRGSSVAVPVLIRRRHPPCSV
jgi:hypothetical protein